MTIAEGVLRLVRSGTRTEPEAAPQDPQEAPAVSQGFDLDTLVRTQAPETVVFTGLEPGFSDLEAAVELVQSGMASRIVLHGFAAWPGLLWRSYQLAEMTDVTILPTIAEGGRVDIVIARNHPIDG
jgi:hypothetical protein